MPVQGELYLGEGPRWLCVSYSTLRPACAIVCREAGGLGLSLCIYRQLSFPHHVLWLM